MDSSKPIAFLSPPESEASSPTSSSPRSIKSNEGSLWDDTPTGRQPSCAVSDATVAEATISIIGPRNGHWCPSKLQESLSTVTSGADTSSNASMPPLEHENPQKSRKVTNWNDSSEIISGIKRERKATSRSLQSDALKRLLQETHPWWDIISGPSSQQPNPYSSDRQITAYTSITGFDPTGRMQKLLDDLTDLYVSDNSFYQSGQAGSISAASQQALTKLFDKYRDEPKSYPDRIGVEGISNYLNDLSVRPDEVVCLGLMEQLNTPTFGELHREGFINGWLNTPPPPGSGSFAPPADTIPRQAAYMKQLRTQIQTDPATFKKVYRFTFNICRPEGQKNVPAETATEMWRLFFSPDNGGVKVGGSTPWLEWWIEFYESKYKRPVNKDLWNMFGEMIAKIQEEEKKGAVRGNSDPKAGFDWWSEEGAWPGAIDEFVEWVAEKRKDGAMDVS